MKIEEIKRHWERSGERFPSDSKITPTSRDPYLGKLERENILACLNEKYTCLEIGCGGALHTVHYAKRVKRLLAIDVADSLINVANKRLQQEGIDNVELYVGSVLDIDERFKGKQFDCVISQRCLINLPDWESQRNAISQVYNLLADEGIFLLTEGLQDNLDNLNSMRTRFSLPEIKVVDYNRNFVSGDLEIFVQQYFEVIEKRHYGPYLFFSRVYHPLVVFPDDPQHDAKMNEVAMNISRVLPMPDLEKYSYNMFYVLKKRNVQTPSGHPVNGHRYGYDCPC